MTVLCLASYFKGEAFLIAAKAEGNRVLLITAQNLEHKPWPHHSIDHIYYVPDATDDWNLDNLAKGVAYIMRTEKIDSIVALDDFDVEKGAYLREQFRIKGMGQTRSRYFRDKLAMRIQAQEAGVPVPSFSALFRDDDINNFAANTPPPYVVKPRSQASATGIKKVHNAQELWEVVHQLGDDRMNYLVEQFVPGDVYHVDSINYNAKVAFVRASHYLAPPMEVAHEGGIFRSMTVKFASADEKQLIKANESVMAAFGMQYSATHTEFIKAKHDGKFYFLETASRVGGAHLAEMVEASSGVNLWAEWAKVECLPADKIYKAPKPTKKYSGIVVSLARQRHPDTTAFNDAEIVWRMTDTDYHIGLIVQADSQERVLALLNDYAQRIQMHHHAAAPSPDKPTH
jgi:hypothetical protein